MYQGAFCVNIHQAFQNATPRGLWICTPRLFLQGPAGMFEPKIGVHFRQFWHMALGRGARGNVFVFKSLKKV